MKAFTVHDVFKIARFTDAPYTSGRKRVSQINPQSLPSTFC